MKKVLAFLVWLFSFWTWKEFFLRWSKTCLSHSSNGETTRAGQLSSQEGQPESEFAHFLSSIAGDERWCRSLLIFGDGGVTICFGRKGNEFRADIHTNYYEFLSAVASSKVGFRETLDIYIWKDDSCKYMEEFVDALRQCGTDLRKLVLIYDKGSAIRFAKCVSSVLPHIIGIQDLTLGFNTLDEVMGKEVAAEFMANIASPDTLRILKSFGIQQTKLDGEGMEQLIKPLMGPHSVLETFIYDSITSDVQLEHISGMLATSTSLKRLYLWRHGRGAQTPLTRGYTKISAALCSNQALETLGCDISSSMELKALLDPLMPNNNSLQRNITLTRLKLSGKMGGKEGIETLVDMLCTNTSLLEFSLFLEITSGDTEATKNVLAILESLKVNKSLKSIGFTGWKAVGGYQVLGAMMDMLLENHCIEHIQLQSTDLHASGDAQYVYSTLSKRRKMKLWEIVQGMANVNPTSGRVFLCGHPYAGKTRLRMSMKQSIGIFQENDETQANSRIGRRMGNLFKRVQVPKVQKAELLLERTHGIEVDNVTCNDINITVWDMAGQTDYHSFHELVMPNLSADGSCSMFLLLCNPIVRQSHPSKGRTPSDIRFELKSWLRFIASNTRRSLLYRPHVSIVMTHFDYWKDDHAFIARIEDVVVELKSLFQEVLEFDEDKVIFKVDGTDVSQACGVFDFIKSHLKQLLQRLPKTISACQEVQNRIALWNANKSKPPLLKWNEFCDDMCKDVGELNGGDLELAKKRREFVAISLNDRGHIIYDEKEGVVITNPHWFCHDIIGQLLHQCATKGRELEMVSSNGFISIDHMKRFMKNLIEGQGDIEKYDDILNMMKKLHICYNQDAKFIMIPSTLKDELQNLSWLKEDESTSSTPFTHIGRRLACKDGKTTMLTPGFFTRIQVSFFNKLQQTNVHNSFELFQNVIKFISDGIQVILQFNHGDIDIFLRSNQCQDKMLEFLENGIITHIKHLQVDPTLGCPGVVLEEYILRPACVQKLLNSKVRKNQYVHMKELEVAVIKYGVDATHNWKPCEGLIVGYNKVKSLLGGVAWKNLLQRRSEDLLKYHQKIQSLRTLAQNDSMTYNEEKNNVPTSLWDIPQRLLFPRLERKFDIMMQENRKHHKDVMFKLDNMMQMIQDLENGIKKMEGELLHEVCSRIDDLMAFSLEMQKSQIPKLAYLCEIGKSELLTRLVPGLDKFQLHLMCENIHGFHQVAKQEGCVVTFGTTQTRRFLAMLEWGLTIATILTKIGAHVTCGMGSMVPDFSDGIGFASLILDTPGLLDYQIPKATLESLPGDVSKISNISKDDRFDAQRWLKDFLEPKCKSTRTMYEEFKLRKVRYRGASGSIAWICDECITKHKHEIDELS